MKLDLIFDVRKCYDWRQMDPRYRPDVQVIKAAKGCEYEYTIDLV